MESRLVILEVAIAGWKDAVSGITESSCRNMSHASRAQPQMGRPRKFDDHDVFLATARAAGRNGYARLTLGTIAAEVTCTAPALVDRFGSKDGLLQAYLRWCNDRVRERFQQVRAENDSPMEALKARFRIPREERIDEVGEDAKAYFNLTLFYISSISVPQLREQGLQRGRIYEEELALMLSEAVAAGELSGCDPARLARTLLATLSGAALQWVSDESQAIEERVLEAIDALTAPYRITPALP